MRNLKTLLATALIAVGVGGAVAAPANAHFGDWYQDYQITNERDIANCKNYTRDCMYGHHYVRTVDSGDHTRIFTWAQNRIQQGVKYTCYRDYYIAHYSIWKTVDGLCIGGFTS